MRDKDRTFLLRDRVNPCNKNRGNGEELTKRGTEFVTKNKGCVLSLSLSLFVCSSRDRLSNRDKQKLKRITINLVD